MGRIITTDWYDGFKCIGDACGLNCCRDNWGKEITEGDYRVIDALSDPYRERIFENIETNGEKRIFSMRDGHCGLLTDDGWCGVVQHCSEEALPAVCRIFPRAIARYGDVEERDVEIACPIVAARLLSDEAVSITSGEVKGNSGNTEERITDIYDILAYVRGRLIALMQTRQASCEYGKLYILYTLLFKLMDLINRDGLSVDSATRITDAMCSPEMTRAAFQQDRTIRENWARRCAAVKNTYYIQDTVGFAGVFSRKFGDDGAIWIYLKDICGDRGRLEQELNEFMPWFENRWPMMMENFFVHALFQDWINVNKQKFGERMIVRAFEYTLIIMLGMAERHVKGVLDEKRYALMIAHLERLIIHNEVVPGIVRAAIENMGVSDGAEIMTILV